LAEQSFPIGLSLTLGKELCNRVSSLFKQVIGCQIGHIINRSSLMNSPTGYKQTHLTPSGQKQLKSINNVVSRKLKFVRKLQ
ncbi:MAG: hypothetical protein AB2659_03715, partial [Candidatus Thiodiazotropha sp.]